MEARPKITFIGAGSMVFLKNIPGWTCSRHEALNRAEIALVDIDPARLQEAGSVADRIRSKLKVAATISTHIDQREALDGADFVVVAFQIGGYEPCTVTDFEISKEIWPEADHRRYLGNRWNHARPQDGTASLEHLRRHDGSLPGCCHASVC